MLVVGLLVGTWELIVVISDLKPFILPGPGLVAAAIWTNRGFLLSNAWVTEREALGGFALAVGLGVPTGVLVAKSAAFRATVYPMIIGSQAIPKLALTPLFTVWLGFGMGSKVIVAFLVAYFPIAITTTVGMKSVEGDARMLARSIGLSRTSTFRKIELPSALPEMFGGLKAGIAFAVIGAVVGELLGSTTGLGHVTLTADTTLDMALVIGALVVLAVLGLVSYAFVACVGQLIASGEKGDGWLGTVNA